MSDYDIETARHMLRTGRYLCVVFMCHMRKGGLADMPRQYLEFIGK